ncbi:MAG: pyridoxamine 5'-phosphate oxidase family protein, partial [Lewinella sp.]|nr:pyridoxamine 5'-phosphate oxidase family protein [Lewinella sp.]
TDLPEVMDFVWDTLSGALADGQHPWRLPAIGTVEDGQARLRTIVLRQVDRSGRRLSCYADQRSAKMAELGAPPRMSWLFYDPVGQYQLRAHGRVVMADEAERRRVWATLPLFARKPYAAGKLPGTPIDEAHDGLPQGFMDRSLAETDTYFQYFAILHTVVDELDWLQLDHTAHVRARYHWRDGQWRGSWIIP